MTDQDKANQKLAKMYVDMAKAYLKLSEVWYTTGYPLEELIETDKKKIKNVKKELNRYYKVLATMDDQLRLMDDGGIFIRHVPDEFYYKNVHLKVKKLMKKAGLTVFGV